MNRAVSMSLLRASHPEPSVAVTVFAVSLSASTHRSLAGVVAVGLAVLAGQLSVGWHNDWLDAERDVRSARSDKPIARGDVSRRSVGLAAATAAIAVVPLSLISGWRAALAHLVAVVLAWSYNAWLRSTPASILPYIVAFPLLVAFITLGLPGAPWPPWWALVTAALLGAGAHLLNVVPDIDDDERSGVRGLPHMLGGRRAVAGALALLLAATVVVEVGPGHFGWLAGVETSAAICVLAGTVILGRRRGGRWLFRGALAVALIDVASLVARGKV